MKTVDVFERGCGWPQPGGFYAMSLGKFIHCLSLPVELPICDCCGLYLKFSRALQIVPPGYRQMIVENFCSDCNCFDSMANFYIDWIGSDYTTEHFIREVRSQGASRRLRPNEVNRLKPGDRILAVKEGSIIAILPVTQIRYYIKGDETEDFLNRLKEKDIEVVKARRIEVVQLSIQ